MFQRALIHGRQADQRGPVLCRLQGFARDRDARVVQADVARSLRHAGRDHAIRLDTELASEVEGSELVSLGVGGFRRDESLVHELAGREIRVRALRQQKLRKRPLVIAVTGHQQHAERLRAYEVGMDLHLTKPVSPDELLHVLRRYQQVAAPATR